MSVPAVNQLHHELRVLTTGQGIHAAIARVFLEIEQHGHGAVKADPGVHAWVMENRSALEPIARLKGLST